MEYFEMCKEARRLKLICEDGSPDDPHPCDPIRIIQIMHQQLNMSYEDALEALKKSTSDSPIVIDRGDCQVWVKE